MDKREIRRQIDANNAAISQILRPCTFTLNNAVSDLLAENRKLQSQCEHEWDQDGFCIYCDFLKEEDE